MSNKKLFQGDTAWFSSSVSQKIKNLWKKNGGNISPLDSAMFVFSQDFTAPDTLQIFSSEAYLNEHLAVIHPMFISDSISKGSKSVLMNYKLPPEEVYKATREMKVYKWDITSELQNGQQQTRTSRLTRSKAMFTHDENKDNMADGSKNRDLSTKDNSNTEHEEGKTTESIESGDVLKKVTAEMCHIDDIPKITGVLEEFIPGENNCEVFRK
ncbi:telomere repeats-binding bouquet formation protein 2-like [Ostrea edulis]|uniref:telomere repeats-binding bouquet formation protein 2-like n=1 Tax=Ostrea edulis TaxID=37623 RepID=UPI0020941C4A|nr:telomere repeats-binding bouquet formation protein 2-like [Ostrea edulis]